MFASETTFIINLKNFCQKVEDSTRPETSVCEHDKHFSIVSVWNHKTTKQLETGPQCLLLQAYSYVRFTVYINMTEIKWSWSREEEGTVEKNIMKLPSSYPNSSGAFCWSVNDWILEFRSTHVKLYVVFFCDGKRGGIRFGVVSHWQIKAWCWEANTWTSQNTTEHLPESGCRAVL